MKQTIKLVLLCWALWSSFALAQAQFKHTESQRDSWNQGKGYCVDLVIENVGDLEGIWKIDVTIPWNTVIYDQWNINSYEAIPPAPNDKIITITPREEVRWWAGSTRNYNISPGNQTDPNLFGFCVEQSNEVPAPDDGTTGGASYTWEIFDSFNTGYCANLTIFNNSSRIWEDWEVPIRIDGTLRQHWNFNHTAQDSDGRMIASNVDWNGRLLSGQQTHSLGFCAHWNCDCTISQVRSGECPCYRGPEQKADNPFTSKYWYYNRDWREKVLEAGDRMNRNLYTLAHTSTAVWMDNAAAIGDLRGHLDLAVQGAGSGTENLIVVVIYNLPDRDCSANASNGDWGFADNGLQKYSDEYIQPIAQIFADPKYANLRIVTIIEPDSLPNMVTNVNTEVNGNPDAFPRCTQVAQYGSPDGYAEGIRLALNSFSKISNVYNYLDIGNHGWLGWESNFDAAVDYYDTLLRSTDKGYESITGFVTNVSGYAPVIEPYVDLIDDWKKASFYGEENEYNSEQPYALDFVAGMEGKGMPAGKGVLIDTSRNGWGGPHSPSGVADTGSPDERVNASRFDQRFHRGSWCNQIGGGVVPGQYAVGIGERPRANPVEGVDAYVWIKPPGESDGISVPGQDIVNGKDRYDQMCDPNLVMNTPWEAEQNIPTGAISAPAAGAWNYEHFKLLVENANPEL